VSAQAVDVEIRFSSWHVFRFAYALNISKGGLLFQSAGKPEVGQILQIGLKLPNGTSIQLEAEVRHVAQTQAKDDRSPLEVEREPAKKKAATFQVGVEFRNLDGERRCALDQALADMDREPRRSS
jgi:hypothetical protein